MMTDNSDKSSVYYSAFEELRRNDGIYVDKTEEIYRISDRLHTCLLLRPPEFGRTLLLDTIADLFAGKHELFEGLYIENHWDWANPCPIMRLDMKRLDIHDPSSLDSSVVEALKEFADRYEIVPDDDDHYASGYVRELLHEMKYRTGKGTTVLIDNYDYPLVNLVDQGLEERELDEMERALRRFYSIFKPCQSETEFILLVGTARVPLADIFGGLNNIYDTTMSIDTATICGFTEEEIDKYFGKELEGVDRDKFRKWYSGYQWWEGKPLYSPTSVLSFIKTKEFGIHIDTTKTPDLVINRAIKYGYPVEEWGDADGRYSVDSMSLAPTDPRQMGLYVSLFRWGYLSAKRESSGHFGVSYEFKASDLETEYALAREMARRVWGKELFQEKTETMKNAFLQNDATSIEQLVKEFLGKLPEVLWPEPYRSEKLYYRYKAFFRMLLLGYFYNTGLDVPKPEIADCTKEEELLSVTTETARYLFDIRMIHTIPATTYPEKKEKQVVPPKEWDLVALHNAEKADGKSLYLVQIEFEENTSKIIKYDLVDLTDSPK